MSDYASQIANAAFNLVKAGFGSTFTTYRQTPMLQVQPADLPILGVFIMREQRAQDGQANEGEPHFKHTLTLGFSGAVQVNTDEQGQLIQVLEDNMSALDVMLLQNVNFVKMSEGITAMDRIGQYSKIGETTLFEIRVEMQMEYSSRWEPVIPDDLTKVVITTQFPDAAHAESGTPQLQQVIALEAVPTEDVTPPSIPMGVTATIISPTAIDLVWSPSTDDVGVTGYEVWRDGVQLATVITTAFIDTELTAGTSHQYWVKALDAAGNVSGPSPIASATTPLTAREGAEV